MSQITTPKPLILIVGAGVAGLALAQGLRARSIPFRLFERYPKSHSSQGHRFRISKEGQAALDTLLPPRVQTLLKHTAADRNRLEPRYVDARKLDFPKPTPVDRDSMPVDRAWFRMLAALDVSDAIEYDKEFISYELVGEQVQVNFADGSFARGQLLVGADGIKSRVRKQLQPDRKLLDLERCVMWGRTPLTDDLKRDTPQDLLTWCMYMDPTANVQAVVEPMLWSKSVRQESQARLPDFSDYVYWVVCTPPSSSSEPLPRTVEEKRAFLETATRAWHPDLRRLLTSAAHELSACAPVLSSKPDIEIRAAGQIGCITLIGDAAHAMSPMGGSGADTAIRNAADLARTVAEDGVTRNHLAAFESRMEERAKERIEHSFRGGQKFWRGKEWTEYSEIDT
ncbi:FAD/NAD(P)-binding domain-containing protein [Thozetella sp. PMI_491]|nr:FAD/NAD(P)-binding domain-containing protein [Thozetella sp. PMI_491]